MTTSVDSPRRPIEADAATHDRLVAAARELRGHIQADAAEQDRERRLTERTIAALRDSGVLRLTVPKAFGGFEAGARTMLDVTTELGRACTSTAWVAGILNTANFMTALLPEDTRREVWGSDPNAAAIGVLAPSAEVTPVSGGVRVTGKWAYSSGSQIADWALMGIPSSGGEQPGPGLVLMPMDQLTVEDTWHVMGMRATASDTVVANDVLVPEDRILSQARIMSGALANAFPHEPVYQSSVVGLLIVSLVGPQLGAVRTALEYVREKAPRRSIATTTYVSQAESVTVQSDLGRAANLIDTADLLLHRAVDVIDDHARRGVPVDVELRSRNRMDGSTASQLIKESMDILVSVHGAGSFADVSPLQRIFRDLNVASRHTGTAVSIPREVHGRVLLGKDPYAVTHLL